ncbi:MULTISPECIES: DUF4097 family beta strand repeat-containing protein [Salinibaculum]|uniref:DUF4097 family beta strand repeat-containing protein n=1 Tax=Salinibaculum TaxID=2732368 RepID=UPI0030D4EB42
MKRRALLACSGTALAAGLAGCTGSLFGSRVTESFDRSYDVADGATLTVSNRNGDVEVRDTDGDQLAVSGEKRAPRQSGLDAISVDVSTGEEIAVDVDLGSGSSFSNRSVELTVEVPDGVAVDSASSSNGRVTVADVAGDVDASSSNGQVEVTDVDGYVRCETSNGDIRTRNTTGLRGAQTSNGTVDVEVLAMRDDVTCRSTNGSVTVRVGPEVVAAFRLSTSNGDAEVRDVEHTVTTSRNKRIEGRLNGGTEPLLRLETTNGDVTLRSADE